MADLALTPGAAPVDAPTPVRRGRPTGASLTLRTIAVLYVGVLVLVPVVLVFYQTFDNGLTKFVDTLALPEVQHAFQVTAVVAGSAVVIDTVFGVAVAILLTRYRFPGRRLLSALIDLPVAVSPIVVGLALVLVFGPDGWFGPYLVDHGVMVVGAKPGMILATAFVALPLVVRSVVPVLEQAGLDQDQAAASLGANAVTRFLRITLPTIRAALAYGVVLTLARCIGEFGAVLVVSQNIQGETETATLRINNFFETDQDTAAAYAVTFVLMLIAFAAILLGAYIRRRKRI